MKPKNLIYFGHGLAGYYGIQRLMRGELRDKIDIKAVIVSDKDQKAEIVKNIASQYGLEVYTVPVSSPQIIEIITRCQPDLGVIMNFDQRIPQEVIDAIPNGIWNVHPSDLPKYRGGLPLEFIVANGDQFRATVHTLTPDFDDGDVVYKSQPVRVWEMDVDELYLFASKQSALALEDALKLYIEGNYKPVSQQGQPTYARASQLNQLLRINWQQDGEQIYRRILAAGKGRGAIAGININGQEKLFRICEANFIANADQHPGSLGQVHPVSDGSYAVSVNGGTLYFCDVYDQHYQRGEEFNQIIHALNRANTNKVVLS